MRKLLFGAILFSGIAFGQDTEFKVTPAGLTDFVVVQKEGKTAADLYSKTIQWINKTYKNPERVILAKVEGDYIRFEGAEARMLCISALGIPTCEDAKYQIEVSFKDGKYKFDVIQLESYTKPSQYAGGGWSEVSINDMAFYFNKSGEVKKIFKNYPIAITNKFNSLNKSLSEYIDGTGEAAKKSDW